MTIAEKIEYMATQFRADDEFQLLTLINLTAELARSVEAYPVPKPDYVTREQYEKALGELQREAFCALINMTVDRDIEAARKVIYICLERLLKKGSE